MSIDFHHLTATEKRDSSVSWFLALCILSKIETKDPKFVHVVPIFTELGQDLTHLAHKKNTQSEIFLWDRQNI
jgi:hypothetical protein